MASGLSKSKQNEYDLPVSVTIWWVLSGIIATCLGVINLLKIDTSDSIRMLLCALSISSVVTTVMLGIAIWNYRDVLFRMRTSDVAEPCAHLWVHHKLRIVVASVSVVFTILSFGIVVAYSGLSEANIRTCCSVMCLLTVTMGILWVIREHRDINMSTN